jgi:hypothetical protein
MSKCRFGCSKVGYFGHIISDDDGEGVGDHSLIKVCALEYRSKKIFLQDKQG